MTGSATRAGDLDVGVIDSGGDGVPLVLVHGGESDRTQFTALRELLGPGIRAISYDQRDSGLANNPPEPYTLVLVATTPSFALGGEDLDELLNMTHEQRVAAAADFFFTPRGQAEQGLRPSRTLTERTPEQSARRHAAARQHEVLDRLGEITARTLVVHGAADRLATYDGALLMHQRIPNAELRSIEDGRHGIGVEFAGTIAHWVREFLGVDA